jgi:hypothetical protein
MTGIEWVQLDDCMDGGVLGRLWNVLIRKPAFPCPFAGVVVIEVGPSVRAVAPLFRIGYPLCR